jgi:predicted NUDIX family NTP pyrophosphohydrolase
MAKHSAGLLIFSRDDDGLRVHLVHPGGPFWRNRDVGAWQIPKGLLQHGEDAATAALREAQEELGTVFAGDLIPLGSVVQAGGKRVDAFALEADLDADTIISNTFEIEWPPRSGTLQSFPEVDAARWFSLDEARTMMLPSQLPFLDRLQEPG